MQKNKKKNYNYNKNSQRSTPTMSEWRNYYNRCAVAQVEYYFTEENLSKDVFLRSRMDVEGFVPLSLIVQFNAIRQLGVDYNTLRSLLVTSPYLDIDLENELVRLRNGWAKWLLSVDGSEGERRWKGEGIFSNCCFNTDATSRSTRLPQVHQSELCQGRLTPAEQRHISWQRQHFTACNDGV